MTTQTFLAFHGARVTLARRVEHAHTLAISEDNVRAIRLWLRSTVCAR